MKKRIAFTALAALPLVFLARHGAQAEVDAVSAASLSVSVSGITATAAIINYSKDKYDYGTRTLCYNPAPAAPTLNCTTKNAVGNQGSFTVSNLASGIQYNFSIKAVDTKGGEKPYTTSGTFQTLKSTGLMPDGPSSIPGTAIRVRVDANGRAASKPEPGASHTVIFTNRMH